MLSILRRKKRRYVVTAEEWANRAKYEDLNTTQQRNICDGSCGINILGKKIVPDFVFEADCCRHDFGYLRGGDERVRKAVDNAFYNAMVRDAQNAGNPLYAKMAVVYYQAVHKFGWMFFRYGPMKNKQEILEAAKKS